MLVASAVDITVGWLWHTAYRARHHWKLKREGALVAAGFVAFVGAIDTARSIHAAPAAPAEVAVVAAPAPVTTPVIANLAPAPAAPAPVTPADANSMQAAANPTLAPQFPIIQDQTGSIDQADPIETILPMDPEAQRDDPIARKINERFGDATEAPVVKKPKPRPVKTAEAKPAKPPVKPAKKKAETVAE
ncbi:hypothetical protein RNI52_18355 [Labrys neptuniae]|uniref:hypothetical protein n=1 Tax=Labrys neptuniae TaxID=376174 RepID=UPI0028917C4D|nr:hypothetical protein [Labrys neptuniae]MDT3379301.1 hypothetical protein [Labrys neptuniae]